VTNQKGDEVLVAVPSMFPHPFNSYVQAWKDDVRQLDRCFVLLVSDTIATPGWWVQGAQGDRAKTCWIPEEWIVYRGRQGVLFR